LIFCSPPFCRQPPPIQKQPKQKNFALLSLARPNRFSSPFLSCAARTCLFRRTLTPPPHCRYDSFSLGRSLISSKKCPPPPQKVFPVCFPHGKSPQKLVMSSFPASWLLYLFFEFDPSASLKIRAPTTPPFFHGFFPPARSPPSQPSVVPQRDCYKCRAGFLFTLRFPVKRPSPSWFKNSPCNVSFFEKRQWRANAQLLTRPNLRFPPVLDILGSSFFSSCERQSCLFPVFSQSDFRLMFGDHRSF